MSNIWRDLSIDLHNSWNEKFHMQKANKDLVCGH